MCHLWYFTALYIQKSDHYNIDTEAMYLIQSEKERNVFEQIK